MAPTNRRRFESFLATYYCTAFLVYSATFLTFFWELQSLLLRFSLPDLLGYFSYQLAFALIESLSVAILVIVLVWLLPFRRVQERPAVVGGLFVLSLAIMSILFRIGADVVEWIHSTLPISRGLAVQVMTFLWLFTVTILPILSVLMLRTERIAGRLRTAIDNLSVLGILYTVLGILGTILVVFRNIS